MKKWILFCGLLILTAGPMMANALEDTILKSICKKSGLFDLLKKDQLKFSFHVQLPDKEVHRTWTWNIQKNTFELSGGENQEKAFVNDSYWLLFPLKAYYDQEQGQCRVTINERVNSPVKNQPMTEVVVAYLDDRGFTPKDTYRLYLDDSLQMTEWSYHRASSKEATRVSTWESYQIFDGVSLSTQRMGKDGFKVWFTDLEVK